MSVMRGTLAAALLLVLSLVSMHSAHADRALPLDLAELVPMSADELLQLAEHNADFAAPATPAVLLEGGEEAAEQQPEDQPAAFAEMLSESHAEADAAVDDAPAPAPAAAPAAANGPNLQGELQSTLRRLKKHRDTIAKLETAIANQTRVYKRYVEPMVRTPVVAGGTSSGANYFERSLEQLKSSRGVSAGNAADQLTTSDARCVICQFLVQQTQGILIGKPLTTGGATSGGKRAAALLAVEEANQAEAAAAQAVNFLELDEMDGESFLELQASVDMMAGVGVDALLAAEMESTHALTAAVDNFLSAADAAMEHSASEAVASHYHRDLPVPGLQVEPHLRNFAPITYPRQLNDHGFEEVTRNRKADVLSYRPRQARFIREEPADAKQKWDQTRAVYQRLYSGVYRALESLCSHKMPLAYSHYCQEMLLDYRYIAQGVQYGDRAQTICMNGNWCDQSSYIRKAVHAFFVREHGDSPV